MKKFLVIFLLSIVAAVFIGTAVFLFNKSREKPVIFEVVEPFIADVVKKTVATGQIIPRKEIDIKSQVSGVLEEVYVQAGQKVKKGELLAKIEIIPNMQVLSAAESQLDRARIGFANASKELGRQKNLFNQKLISEAEFTKYRLDYDLQREAVDAAESNVELIKDGASKKSGKVSNLIKATVDGMVLNVPVKQGAFIMEYSDFKDGTTIVSIANMADMIFEGKVDESEVGKIKEGMNLVLNVGAVGTEKFNAVLEYISPKGVADQGTIKFEIRAAVKLSDDNFLRAGYSANADIVLGKKEKVLVINEGHLLTESNKTFVEVMTAPQTFEKREVKTGLSDGINVEIVEGLRLGQQIKKQQ